MGYRGFFAFRLVVLLREHALLRFYRLSLGDCAALSRPQTWWRKFRRLEGFGWFTASFSSWAMCRASSCTPVPPAQLLWGRGGCKGTSLLHHRGCAVTPVVSNGK